MQLALDQAKLQKARYGDGEGVERPNPLVGCVVVAKSGVVETGYRGEKDEDDHAEYIALEKKTLARCDHAGATVYTTLEPCTERKGNKVPCADRLVDAGVSRVFIGIKDPDERGAGYQKLFENKIELYLFDNDLAQEIGALNRHFIESRKKSSLSRTWFSEVERACAGRVKI